MNFAITRPPRVPARAFSLIEVLAAVAIIGILAFLALPNIVQVKTDSERSLAISKAEGLNLAIASYISSVGETAAIAGWDGINNDSTLADEAARQQEKYSQVAPFLAYAPATLATYTPDGYSITMPASILPLTKVTLKQGTTTINY
ncbi:MAG: type II secretion system protein [Verrucomicrobiales bacterium]